jgi:hypothetical protein
MPVNWKERSLVKRGKYPTMIYRNFITPLKVKPQRPLNNEINDFTASAVINIEE